jgi:type IV secretion system protein VirB3
MTGKLTSDPLFVGLTRPAMIFGVSLKFAAVNMMVSSMLFIQGGGIIVVAIALCLHIIGYILCFKEPKCIELFLTKISKCNQCPNKFFYGANSYGI